jgi:uncharacterized protein DUF222/HNH endonuclease
MLQQAASAEQRAQELVFLEHQISLLQLEASMLAAELLRDGFLDDEGYNSRTDWMRFNCHLTDRVAADRIRVGEHVGELPMSIDYLRDGEIGYAHLATMARTANAVGQVFDEKQLLPLALEHTPGKFYFKSLHYRHSVDAKKYAEEQAEEEHNHRLSLSTAEDGCLLINGVLDPVSGAAVRTVLEPLARPSGAHDDRLLPKRYADAMVEALTAGKPVNLQVTATIETLKGLAGAAGGDMEFSLPISSATVRRMACECSVTRVLLSQDSVTIDVGRSTRVLSTGLRRALRVRDGHCQWPGCERPASLCHGHHLTHWTDGGETALGNLILLCHRHHRMVHEGGWQIIRCDDGQIITIAPTVTFGLPRGPD